MSVSLSPKTPIRVLVAEDSEETASRIDSVLRDAGFATRILRSDDFDRLIQSLADNECDIAYLPVSRDDIENILPRLRAANRNVPIIAYHVEQTHCTPGETMALGASDLIDISDATHLGQVSVRELEHVCQRVRAAQLSKALKEAEQRCLLLLQGSRAPIAYIHEGMHVYANQAYLQFFGCEDVDDMLGVSVIDFLSPASAADFKEQMKLLRGSTDECRFPFTGTAVDGNALEGTLVLANSIYEGEVCLQLTVLPSQSTPAINAPANEDNLDLGSFLKMCEDRLPQGGEGQAWMFLSCLEGVERIRTELGLLRAERVADLAFARMGEVTRGSPMLRLSQNEFAVALFGADRHGAGGWAESLQHAIQQNGFELDSSSFPVTVSLSGVKISNDVEHALDAGYQQLQEIVTSDSTGLIRLEAEALSDSADMDDAGRMLARITGAIENQSFRLLYQPIISLRGDADEHYEVFLRMIDSAGNEHVPDQFLRTAIEHGVAAKMDRWVILQSIKALCLHRAKGHNTRLTINVTSNSVTDSEFIKWLTVAIKAARLPSDAVIFQITEQDATTYKRQTADFVAGLKRMHCQASIGRFGLVPNPFVLLGTVPVDMVKIDGSLLRLLQREGDVITPMLRQLQTLGKFTIVPMVESAAQLTALWQAGANYIQGHYLQEPHPEMDYDFSVEEQD